MHKFLPQTVAEWNFNFQFNDEPVMLLFHNRFTLKKQSPQQNIFSNMLEEIIQCIHNTCKKNHD
ncbi:MAG: hypothetical protein D3920_08190 [Candidatus Electrothrix sp. AW2]|nr:hypothetical protein [Candidatus Electrothrix gigas]MCI5189574.1 hypothetical protein [Candidatus Electrothrix gigas]